MKHNYLYEKFKISEIAIPETIIIETEKHLREYGRHHHEGMLFWTGRLHHDTATIISCFNLVQTCTAVSVDIAPDELQRLNSVLSEKKEVLIAQVHSHPGAAFHSSRDDSMQVTYTIGFFSLVVPYFCKNGMNDLSELVIIEYVSSGKWKELNKIEIIERFKVINS